MAVERVMTILGTRPEIIRLSEIISRLDVTCEHVLVHTGQNYDNLLSDIFLRELEIRSPDAYLGVRSDTSAGQIGQILEGTEALMLKVRPTRILVLGDTNSGLSAIMARRLGIPVYHLEAGNRCFDDRVPEEVNRRVIDHASTVLMPYTNRSRENLLREGIASQNIFVTGNPIYEVLNRQEAKIANSHVLGRLGLVEKQYFLVTLHRAENVDIEQRLRAYVEALLQISREHKLPVVCSVHPRTRSRLQSLGIEPNSLGLRFLEPFGFFDFVKLEAAAACVLSDSGTVQEEACILGVPNVTLRDVTERPETLECGSNILAGSDANHIAAVVRFVLTNGSHWKAPAEYLVSNVSEIVTRIVLSYRNPDLAELTWRAASGHQAGQNDA